MSDLRQRAIEHMERHQTLHDTECDLDVDTNWPYECVAKDENPNDVVIVCRNHLVWSRIPRTA